MLSWDGPPLPLVPGLSPVPLCSPPRGGRAPHARPPARLRAHARCQSPIVRRTERACEAGPADPGKGVISGEGLRFVNAPRSYL
ncbi:hypothetical protein AAFF_G00262990 [Aldrovandia affinis]|uniref:Uncharacterized protein n=1 Tax=Aldrovandia affinis TaxID=143900 RepID=A0AAD7WSR5_9TELE|nr:hypothetical protein AAFF_G00262990 [Aldrovandia affinis]